MQKHCWLPWHWRLWCSCVLAGLQHLWRLRGSFPQARRALSTQPRLEPCTATTKNGKHNLVASARCIGAHCCAHVAHVHAPSMHGPFAWPAAQLAQLAQLAPQPNNHAKYCSYMFSMPALATHKISGGAEPRAGRYQASGVPSYPLPPPPPLGQPLARCGCLNAVCGMSLPWLPLYTCHPPGRRSGWSSTPS